MKKIISIVAVILLVAMLGVILIACTPKTIEDAKAKFEKKGYDVSTRTGKKVPSYYAEEGVIGTIYAESEDEEEYFEAFLFETKDDAKEAYKDYEDDLKDEAEDDDDFVYGQTGFYFGTKAADNIFK